MDNLTTLFTNKLELGNIIRLENSKREVVGAIYPNLVDTDRLTVLQLDGKMQDRYYIVLSGLAVFFTYYRFEERQ